MNLSATIDYAATPEQVFAMLSDPEFQARKCVATGALNHDVSITEPDGRTVVVTKRTMATEGFPDFARSMVGATIVVTETNDWGPAAADGSRQGRLNVELGGAPVGVTGTLTLAPDGQGTVERIDGDLKARVPLFGGRIEQAAAPGIEAAIDAERRTGQAWLAG